MIFSHKYMKSYLVVYHVYCYNGTTLMYLLTLSFFFKKYLDYFMNYKYHVVSLSCKLCVGWCLLYTHENNKDNINSIAARINPLRFVWFSTRKLGLKSLFKGIQAYFILTKALVQTGPIHFGILRFIQIKVKVAK